MKKINLQRGLAAAYLILLLFSACTKQRTIHEEGNLVPKTAEYDPAVPAIRVNGTILHSEAFGHPDSALIVVLHGGPGSDYRYLLNCRAFAGQGYRVVFYDQRGSGLSKRHEKQEFSIQLMLDDLAAVIAYYKTNPAQKVFLLGHSWGAMLATAYINQYPSAIDGVILGEPGGFKWPDVKAYVERAREIRITSELLNDLTYQEQFITGKESQHAILDYKFGMLSIAEGEKNNPTGNEGPLPFWRSGAIVNHALFELGDRDKPDWTMNLHSFGTRVLFVFSERNKAYGQSHAQHVSSAYPDVQLLRVNNAGHDMLSFPAGWSQFFPVALSYYNSLK